MRQGEDWSGRGKVEQHPSQLLNLRRHANHLLDNKLSLPKQKYHQTKLTPLKPSDVSSPSCFVIWSVPRDSLENSIRKTSGRSSGSTKECVRKSSKDTMAMSPNSSATVCWSILAIRKPMKTILNVLFI